MTPQEPKPKVVEITRKRTGRKRVSHLMPELRKRIPALFYLNVPTERIAEDLGISRMDAMEEVMRDVVRKGPDRETNVVMLRRADGAA